jgi:hypothetical protein
MLHSVTVTVDPAQFIVSEDGVLRKVPVFRPKWDEIRAHWKGLRIEELHDLNCSPNAIRRIKARRMRWVGHVAWVGERRGAYRILVGEA